MRPGTGHGWLYRVKSRKGEPLPTWHMGYYVPGRKQPIRRSTGTTDEAEATRILHERLGESRPLMVERLAREDITVARLLDLVKEDYADEGQKLPPGMVEAWTAELGAARAIEVRRADLDAISRKWRAKGITWPGRKPGCVRPLNKSTVNRYMAFLRRAYSLGKEKLGLVTGLTFPHLKETNVGRAIPAAILQAILGSEALMTKWPIRGEFFRFKYLSGVRRGQLLQTRLAQFQPDTGTMTWRPEQTKTEDAHNVAYTGEALEILLGFWERRDLACPTFFQEKGTPLTSDKLNEAWWAACKEIKLPIGRKSGGYVIHELRHTFVSEGFHAGLSEKAIMDMTGHKAVQTLHRYGHTSADGQRAAQERVAAWRAQQASATSKVTRLRYGQ